MGRGAFVPLLLVLAACAADAPEPVVVSTLLAPPTVPSDIAAGEGTLVLGFEVVALEVEACSLAPAPSESPGVTIELTVSATAPDGAALTITRESFTGAAPTVTDSVLFVGGGDGGLVVEARRVDADGRILDLLAPEASSRLVEVVDGTLVLAEGRFGRPGARGPEPSDLDGSLVLRCP